VHLLVELSGEHPDMATAEAVAAASALAGRDASIVARDEIALVLEAGDLAPEALAARLGLAHTVMTSAVSGPLDGAVELAASVDIRGAGTFRVRARRSEAAGTAVDGRAIEREAGAAILARRGARVDLFRPEAEVRVLLCARAHAGLLGGRVERTAMVARASGRRPFSLPVSIHPKFARAMVNLSRAGPGASLVDPFCGTGGIIIEAALMGCSAAGSDLDQRMVAGTRTNLEHLGLRAHLTRCDVGAFPEALHGPFDAVVTDPPYGKSTWTGGEGPGPVLARLFDAAARGLRPGGRMVVCVPEERMLPHGDNRYVLESVHHLRVHRSLTRHVATLMRA